MNKTLKTAFAIILSLQLSIATAFAQTSDTTPPTDVNNLRALPNTLQINLSWESAKDNIGVTKYLIYVGNKSAFDNEGVYNLGTIEIENKTNYELKTLPDGAPVQNNVIYYFAVTALDAAENESEYYSNEAKVILGDNPADLDPPTTIENLKAISQDKSVNLTWNPAADNKSVTGYMIYYGTKSVQNPGDEYEKSVKTTNETKYTITKLTNGTTYYFTVTALDANNNESIEYSDETSAIPQTQIIEEEIKETPEQNDEVDTTEENNTDDKNEEEKIIPDESKTEDKPNQIEDTTKEEKETTEKSKDTNASYETVGSKIITIEEETKIDESENEEETYIEEENSHAAAQQDTTPPADATNLTPAQNLNDITLTWNPNISDADISSQNLYLSTDKGSTYTLTTSLDPQKNTYTFSSLNPDTEYTFKITSVDNSDNESLGTVVSLKTLPNQNLPSSGPEIFYLIIFAITGSTIIPSFIKNK